MRNIILRGPADLVTSREADNEIHLEVGWWWVEPRAHHLMLTMADGVTGAILLNDLHIDACVNTWHCEPCKRKIKHTSGVWTHASERGRIFRQKRGSERIRPFCSRSQQPYLPFVDIGCVQISCEVKSSSSQRCPENPLRQLVARIPEWGGALGGLIFNIRRQTIVNSWILTVCHPFRNNIPTIAPPSTLMQRHECKRRRSQNHPSPLDSERNSVLLRNHSWELQNHVAARFVRREAFAMLRNDSLAHIRGWLLLADVGIAWCRLSELKTTSGCERHNARDAGCRCDTVRDADLGKTINK